MKQLLKYVNPVKYLNRLNLILNKYVYCYLEFLKGSDNSEMEYPPIFVVGPPRSGSTLAIQLITEAIDIAYFSNRHAKYFGIPFIIEKYFNPCLNRPIGDFSSTHGRTQGAYSPSEAGNWWYRFFRKEPSYVSLEDADPSKMKKFRKSTALFVKAAKKPIIFKNMYETVRMQPIKKYIPESLFIVLHRNEIDNGHSLLETRYKVYGNYQTWWSVKVPGKDYLEKCSPGEQVIEQVRGLHDVVQNDLKEMQVDPKEILNMSYEKLCEKPEEVIGELQNFLSENGVSVKRRAKGIPEKFKQRTVVRIDQTIYDEMVGYAKNNRHS